MSDFHGTEIEIWAGFGPVGSTEKKNWADSQWCLDVDMREKSAPCLSSSTQW